MSDKKKTIKAAKVVYEMPNEKIYKELELRNEESKKTEVIRIVKRIGNL